jgi:hypothetical protein
MGSWADIESAHPDFAGRVQRLFDAHKHKTLATLRKDGSPRISGIEVEFKDGEVTLGMMAGSLKAMDLQRDPRLALHSASDDPPKDNPSTWPGDAKMAGLAVDAGKLEGAEYPGEGVRFTVDVKEVVMTRVAESNDHLVIESWHEGRSLEVRARY